MALTQRALSNSHASSGSEEVLLDNCTDKQLLKLRAQIDSRLNITDLANIDIGLEIVVQLQTLKILQSEALEDDEAPHGQKAQAAMTVSRLLQDLTKCRRELYDAERSKTVENMVIQAMKDTPQEVKDSFFADLERYLATLPTMDTLLNSTSE